MCIVKTKIAAATLWKDNAFCELLIGSKRRSVTVGSPEAKDVVFPKLTPSSHVETHPEKSATPQASESARFASLAPEDGTSTSARHAKRLNQPAVASQSETDVQSHTMESFQIPLPAGPPTELSAIVDLPANQNHAEDIGDLLRVLQQSEQAPHAAVSSPHSSASAEAQPKNAAVSAPATFKEEAGAKSSSSELQDALNNTLADPSSSAPSFADSASMPATHRPDVWMGQFSPSEQAEKGRQSR